ncbi:MAG TPA: YceI family protein [Solirubrobacteraceae bacterium]|nr:YceI family protein [Solirubrobacteraceae bacterium]
MNSLLDHRFADTLAGRWQLDPKRSSVAFSTGNFWGLMKVKGRFDEYQGRLDLSADPAIELTIDAASVQTGNQKRDQHLRSDDFFDAENHGTVRFVSDSADLRGDTLKVHGRLFARDQSIPLELDAHVRDVDGELAIEASTSAPHRELGMTWSPLKIISAQSELRVTGYLLPAST